MSSQNSPRRSRREFLASCVACAGCAACGLKSKSLLAASPLKKQCCQRPPRIRLVFCETSNNSPIWPNLGYDFDARRRQLLELLKEGCPELEFLPSRLMDRPQDADNVLAKDSEVDGYIIFLQGLGWRNDIPKLCTTGKPTLIFDNLFGGSGKLLTTLQGIMSSGQPVDWIASSKDEHLVKMARQFLLLQRGKSAEEVAEAFRKTRRALTPHINDWHTRKDSVPEPDFDAALKELRRTSIVVVGGGWGGDYFRKAAYDLLGLKFIPVKFEELSAAYEQADEKAAKKFAESWAQGAEKIVEPSQEDIFKGGKMAVAMRQLMKKYQAQGISVNCLGGFYGGHLKAYPCLGFSQFNNELLVGGCESDQMSALTMMTVSRLFGRPGFISDPVIDVSRAAIIYAHCVATTKPFGPDGPTNAYRIRSHSEDRRGACVQSLFPVGYLVTTLEINPVSKKVIVHQGKTIGNNFSDMACRTKVEAAVKGDVEKLAESWSMGWHRVTFVGDLLEPLKELCERLKLELIYEA